MTQAGMGLQAREDAAGSPGRGPSERSDRRWSEGRRWRSERPGAWWPAGAGTVAAAVGAPHPTSVRSPHHPPPLAVCGSCSPGGGPDAVAGVGRQTVGSRAPGCQPDQSLQAVATQPVGGGSRSRARSRAAARCSLQLRKIKRAHRLQLGCARGLLEGGGEVVEPRMLLILELEQGGYRILPACGRSCGVAACGTAAAGARPCGARESAAVVAR